MRFGSTAKVPTKCKLNYYRISECPALVHGKSCTSPVNYPRSALAHGLAGYAGQDQPGSHGPLLHLTLPSGLGTMEYAWAAQHPTFGGFRQLGILGVTSRS